MPKQTYRVEVSVEPETFFCRVEGEVEATSMKMALKKAFESVAAVLEQVDEKKEGVHE